MPVNFRFVPTSGSLSGEAFEKQVAQAFNELGEHIDQINLTTDDATGIVHSALATGNAALSAAHNAQNIAQNAKDDVATYTEAIQQTRDGAAAAQTAAAAALVKAEEANNGLHQLLGTLAATQATADQASSTAQQALHLAKTNADLIIDVNQVAAEASGQYRTLSDAIDADIYSTPGKLYIVNDASTHFPASVPLCFSIETDDRQTIITQTVHNQTGTSFVRIGAITDPGNGTALIIEWSEWKTPGGATTPAGMISLLPYRAGELPPGWYFANGDQYALNSAQGMALAILPENFKSDWGITVAESNISLPNLFYSDGQGYFLRGVNGATRQTGSIEIDQMRPITGSIGIITNNTTFSTGAFRVSNITTYGGNNVVSQGGTYSLDSSRLGKHYNGSDTHPVNVGMTPAIFLGV